MICHKKIKIPMEKWRELSFNLVTDNDSKIAW